MDRKTAVITGASRGLGRNMAIKLAQKGVDIVFSYHTNRSKANELIKEIEALGQKASAFPFNAQKPASGGEFIKSVCSHLEKENGSPNFDFLINNAGTGTFNMIGDTTESQFDEMMNIHLKSVYFMTQAALPFINEGGRIINISTGLTRFSFPGMSAYAIMKGGIEVYSRFLAKELGKRQISVNTVAPGAIETDFGGGSNKDPDKQAVISNITALGRVGVPEDIGGVVAFLCSEGARWINGQRIEVSGGMLV